MDRQRDKIIELLTKARTEANAKKIVNFDGKEISNALKELMNNSEIAQIVHWTLMSIGSCQDKRLMVTENVLKDLQVRNLTATRRTAIVSEIALDIGKCSPRELVALINFCIDSITQDKDEHKSWKELLPKLLSAVVEKEEVLVSGTPKTGEEYKIDVIHTLCMGHWDPKSLAPIASMFIDVPMKSEEQLQVINKLCSAIPDLVTNELPPLVHELLRLCKNGSSIILFTHLQEYFADLLYNPVNDQPDSCEDISDDRLRSTRAKPAESTILFYVNQSANMGDASVKDLVKAVKRLKSSSERVFEPFLLTVLLSVTNVSALRELALEVLRQTVVTIASEEDKRSRSAWVRANTCPPVSVDKVVSAVIRCSIRERESVIKGLVSLAFALLNVPVSSKVREPMAERLWGHGNHIVVTLLKKQGDELGAIVLNHISISIRLKQAVRQHIACLQAISTHSRITIMQNDAIIISLMEHFVYMEENTALELVKALLPGIKHYKHLKDTIIVILRKALYSSTVETRVVAATSFLLLLKHFKVNSMGVLSQNSQASSSSRNNQSFFESESQQSSSSLSSNSICLEILGVLRRCLMQQAAVKQALFNALSNSICKNPELLSYVEDILSNHLSVYYNDDETVLPPLDFTKVVVVKDLNVTLKEPLGSLIFVCQQVITQDSSHSLSRSGVKLQRMLGSLTDRMTKCTLEDLMLTDATELLDNLPENVQKQENVKQTLGVYEALMAYVLSSWQDDSTDGNGRKLVSLFKSYTRLVDFCKSTSKAKKSDCNETTVKRPNNMKSQSQTKKKGGGGKAIAFKFPASLWDHPTALKMLELIYEESLDWCSEDAANQVKSVRDLRKHSIQVTSQLLKLPQTRKQFLNSPGTFVKLANLLYRNVICKLLEEIEYDHAVAIVAVECFTDLLILVGALPKQSDFIAQVVDSKDRPLMKIISTYEKLLTEVLGQDEDKEEPGSKKLPPLLVTGLSLLVSFLPADTQDLAEVYDWVKEFATETEMSNDQVANGILELLLNVHIRCKTSGNVFDGVALQLCSMIGTHLADEVDKPFTKLAVVTDKTRNAAILLLCSALSEMLQDVQWMIGRFQSEYAALELPNKQTRDERRKALTTKERSLCLHLSYIINVVIYLCHIDLQSLPSALISVLRLVSNLYVNITSLTRYFFLRSTKLQPAFQAAKFENLVKLCGKELSRSVNDFIVHVENCSTEDQGKNKNNKKKEVDPLTLKIRILREEKIIPKVTFDKEQFEKWLIKLSVKTKIDLMEHVKVGGAHDFRIKRSKLKSGLKSLITSDAVDSDDDEGNERSGEEEANDRSDEEQDVANGQSSEDETSRVEPKRKKQRSK